MIYNKEKREIENKRELSNLDKLVLEFIKMLEKYDDYVIISGYVSILLGRARATEDVDVFIKKISKEKFSEFYKEIDEKGFWCINAESVNEIYSYLEDGLAIRFARKGTAIPNFEVKFPKKESDFEAFNDRIKVRLSEGSLWISSLERQIAFKKYYLKSEKDLEDAKHVEESFKGQIEHDKINKLKELIEKHEKRNKRAYREA